MNSIALATLWLAGAATHPPGTATACELALQVARHVTAHDYGKPVVFDDGDKKSTQAWINARALASGWTTTVEGRTIEVAPPPEEVATKFVDGVRNAVPRCLSIRDWLKSRKIAFGKRAVSSVYARSVNDELPAGVFTVGLPAISSDGDVAVVYTSDTWGGEAGGGFAHLYRRQADGSWMLVTVRRLWIS